MDRSFYYPTQQPTAVTMLTAERAKMIALGYLAQGVLGTNTVVDGLAVTPTAPATLAVQIAPGSIYAVEPLDTVAYSSLGTDTVDQIVKQGIALSVPNITLTPPGTSGQAINYLIEVGFSEVDTGSAVLPYYNSANPAVPFSGPNGTGVSQPTIRQGTLVVQAKAGVAATAGSQVTPAPDAGFVGIYVVTVANGASAINSTNISQYASAPFIAVKLPALPAWIQAGTWCYAADTGTANAIAIALSPQPTTPPESIFVKKMSAANTSAMNVTITGLGTYSVINPDGTTITSGEVPSGYLMHLVYDGSSYRFMNWVATSAVGSLSASSGEGISVSGGGAVSLNYPGLATENTVASTDLWSFFSQADTHHRTMSWANLLAKISAGLGVGSSASDGNMIAGNYGGAAPSNTLGLNGDYAFDVSDGYVYGPKAGGVWPTPAVWIPPVAAGVATSSAYPVGSVVEGVSGGGTARVSATLGFSANTVQSVASVSGSTTNAQVTFVGGAVVVMTGPNATTNIVAGQIWRCVADQVSGVSTTFSNPQGAATYTTSTTYNATMQRIG